MRTATSASATWRAPASASLNTATERIPMARNVRMTRTAISPRLATRTVSKVWEVISSHPEDAVGHGLQRSLCNDRKCQADHRSGVGGIDDAVVPQPCRGVVRVALVLVLLADGRLERLFLLGGHVATDGCQHG